MTKRMLAIGLVSLVAMALYASPALAKHRHAFERGFLDESGRIGAHAAANLGANILGSVLYGSGLAYGTGGPPYGGRWRGGQMPYYPEPVIEHHHYHHEPVRKIYIYRESYPTHYRHRHRNHHRHHHDDDCDDD